MDSSDSSNFSFLVGQVVGFWGLKGEVKVRPSTNNPELLLDAKEMLFKSGPETTLLQVKNLRLDKRLLFASFQNHNDRTAVEFMLDGNLFTTHNQLRNLDESEWWVNDLIGLTAYTTDGTHIGVITNVVQAGHQILEITPASGTGTILVPFVQALVPVVDIPAGQVKIADLPGLLHPQ